MVTQAIDLKDMCKIAQDIYQGLADERDAESDDSMEDEKKTLKERLTNVIESEYLVSFDEFCKVVNTTCNKDQEFSCRLNTFFDKCDIDADNVDAIQARHELQEWIEGKKSFTVSQLIHMIMNIDLMCENAGEYIPELFRFNCVIGSRGEKCAEYYAKVLYPIYLLKSGFIKIS